MATQPEATPELSMMDDIPPPLELKRQDAIGINDRMDETPVEPKRKRKRKKTVGKENKPPYVLSKWQEFVKDFRLKHPELKYDQVLSSAALEYKKEVKPPKKKSDAPWQVFLREARAKYAGMDYPQVLAIASAEWRNKRKNVKSRIEKQL